MIGFTVCLNMIMISNACINTIVKNCTDVQFFTMVKPLHL